MFTTARALETYLDEKGSHVLLVDDDRATLRVFGLALDGMGLHVHLADSAESAYRVLRAQPIDVVVSDFALPRVNGGTLLRQLQTCWPDTVRILVTGYQRQPEIDALVRDVDIFRVLAKPCSPGLLKDVIAEALERKQRGTAGSRGGDQAPTPPDRNRDEAIFKQAFRAASLPMMIADLDGNVVELNRSFVESHGGSTRAALDRRPRLLSGSGLTWSGVKQVLLEQGRWSDEVQSADGARCTTLSISMIKNDAGEPSGFVAVEQDTSRCRTLEEALLELQHHVPLAIAKLAEFREPDTGPHLERIRSYCSLLAVELDGSSEALGSEFVHTIFAASPLHDVGKMAIPDSILLKPGKMTEREWEVMQTHSRVGAEVLALAAKGAMEQRWLEMGRIIALQHHERWDGSGYPDGLAGEQIDIAARITALADAYDCITSKRVYKEAASHQVAVERIVEASGSHFDPEVVQAFRRIQGTFAAVAVQLRGGHTAEANNGARGATDTLHRIDGLLRSLISASN